MYSNRELFERAVEGLRKQKAFSLDESGEFCLYRGPNGLKCAVGMIMDNYDCEWENSIPNQEMFDEEVDLKFIESMQLHIHDKLSTEEWDEQNFEEAVKAFEEEYVQ